MSGGPRGPSVHVYQSAYTIDWDSDPPRLWGPSMVVVTPHLHRPTPTTLWIAHLQMEATTGVPLGSSRSHGTDILLSLPHRYPRWSWQAAFSRSVGSDINGHPIGNGLPNQLSTYLSQIAATGNVAGQPLPLTANRFGLRPPAKEVIGDFNPGILVQLVITIPHEQCTAIHDYMVLSRLTHSM